MTSNTDNSGVTYDGPARSNVTVTFTVADGITAWQVSTALQRAASEYGNRTADVRGIVVDMAPGERTVTMSESAYLALTGQGTDAGDTATAPAGA